MDKLACLLRGSGSGKPNCNPTNSFKHTISCLHAQSFEVFLAANAAALRINAAVDRPSTVL